MPPKNLVESALELVDQGSRLDWAVVESADDARADQLNLVAIDDESWEIKWGQVDAAAGDFAMKSLEAVVNDLASTKVDVLVTLPINKEAMAPWQIQSSRTHRILGGFRQRR